MPAFSSKSKANLETCQEDLQKLFNEVIKHWDCTILEGRRSKQRQDELYNEGKTKVKWPNSKHNVKNPTDLSRAVDVVPYPIIWPDKNNRPNEYAKDLGRFYAFVGFVLGTAKQMGIEIRVGADWDGDTDLLDQSFDDLPHFELK